MCASNLGYQAVLASDTALFVTAGQLLGELAAWTATLPCAAGCVAALRPIRF